MGYATSLFNLMRKHRRSIGIAVTGTNAVAPQPGDHSAPQRQRDAVRSGVAVDALSAQGGLPRAGAEERRVRAVARDASARGEEARLS